MSKVQDIINSVFDKVSFSGVDSKSGDMVLTEVESEDSKVESEKDSNVTDESKSDSKVEKESSNTETDTEVEVKDVKEELEEPKPDDTITDPNITALRAEVAELKRQNEELEVKDKKVTSEAIESEFEITEPEKIDNFYEFIQTEGFEAWLKNYILHTTKPYVDSSLKPIKEPVTSMIKKQQLASRLTNLMVKHKSEFDNGTLMPYFKQVLAANQDKLGTESGIEVLFYKAQQLKAASTKSVTTIKQDRNKITKKEVDDAVSKTTTERDSAPVNEEAATRTIRSARDAAEAAFDDASM